MPFLFALLFLLSYVSATGGVYAYYDDSVVIEIGDAPPPVVEEGLFAPPNTTPTSPTQNGGSGSASQDSGTHTTTSESIILDVFTSSGAITQTTQGDGGSASSQTQNPSGSSASNGPSTGPVKSSGNTSGAPANKTSSGGGSKGGTVTTLDGAKIRSTVHDNVSFRKILEAMWGDPSESTKKRGLSQNEVSLFGASTILNDSHIDQVIFGATRFEVVYRSQGYLFGFIPKQIPIHILVDPQAAEANDRVVITLPWYRFFARTFFTNFSLTSQIDEVVANFEPEEGDNAADVQKKLFEAVAALLSKEIGTVRGSVQGG